MSISWRFGFRFRAVLTFVFLRLCLRLSGVNVAFPLKRLVFAFLIGLYFPFCFASVACHIAITMENISSYLVLTSLIFFRLSGTLTSLVQRRKKLPHE
ncbi:hypothetical protein BDZ91DRAFT_417102 [Kalaharituber pfeilii]|nr:hypothetical protein BDZ91DRAFT_417102 [Kalaharituber pfeilii]